MRVMSNKKKTLDSKTGKTIRIEDQTEKRRQNQTKEKKQEREKTNQNSSKKEVKSSYEYDEQIRKIERDLTTADYDMTKFIKDYTKWSDNPKVIRNQMDVASYMYCMKLDIACMEPLARGVDSNSIAESIGMSIGLRLASKEYREYKKAEAAQKRYDRKQNSSSVELRKGLAELSDKAVDFLNENQNKFTSQIVKGAGKFASWLRDEKHLKEANGGIIPITRESAAVTYIGLTRRAYQDMREPGADVDKIYRQYDQARECLYEQAKYYNISRDSLNQEVQKKVTKMAEKYPDMSMFAEIGNDQIEIKNGNFVKKDGMQFSESFNPRRPDTKEDYTNKLADMFSRMYSTCDNMKEIGELNFEKNGMAKNMDQLRMRFCSDFGENKFDVTKINEEFNEMYTKVAMVELKKWSEKDANRKRELDAYLDHLNHQEQDVTQNYESAYKSAREQFEEMLNDDGYEDGFDDYDIEIDY